MIRTKTVLVLLTTLGLAGSAYGQWVGRPEPAWEKSFQAWVADPHTKIFPSSFGRDLTKRQIEIQACRNEWVIVQLGVRSPLPIGTLSLRAGDFTSAGGKTVPLARSRSIAYRYARFPW